MKPMDIEEGQLNQQMQQQEQQRYQQQIAGVKPKPTILKNVFWAFVIGGIICTIGQGLVKFFSAQGLGKTEASAAVSATLVFTTALLTGLGVWDSIVKVAGAGAIVPITGFANSMVAPALEFKREGWIFGTAAKLFTIAGPVIVFGLVTAWLIGLIAFLLH